MWPTCSLLQTLLFCVSLLGSCCVSASAAAAVVSGPAVVSVAVDPKHGADKPGCNLESPCKTISYAIQIVGASFVSLSAGGIFDEPTVNISGSASLVISGMPSATIDCSRRLQTTGPAFSIVNSAVVVTGISFQNCYNPTSYGGALSASGSSVLVSQCSFINCSAASGGAISVIGPGDGLVLNVQSSIFTGNSANGGLVGCPEDPALPCSTWGGAIAAFEIFNVTIRGCTMISNRADAQVPIASGQYNQSRNAVAGGGGLSVLYNGNASGASIDISGNNFTECTVDIPKSDITVYVGNGVYLMTHIIINRFSCFSTFDSFDCSIRRGSLCLLWPRVWNAAAGRVTFETRAPEQRVHDVRGNCKIVLWRQRVWRWSFSVHRRLFLRVL
jgi:hypothetical protein